MSAIEATGKVFKVFETKQVTERFRKREFVLEIEDGKYPQKVLFEATGDTCDVLPKIGDEVKVFFNLRGREWESPKDGEIKYFNSLDLWKFEVVRAAPEQGAAAETDAIPF